MSAALRTLDIEKLNIHVLGRMGNCLYTRSGHRMVQKPCTDRDNYSIRLNKDPDLCSGKEVLSDFFTDTVAILN